MRREEPVAWRWTAWRIGVSAFVAFHVSAISLWTTPDCAIKQQFQGMFRYYVLPLGLWQWWAIFAPEPVKNTLELSVEVVDSKGLRHIYDYPRLAPMPWWQKALYYREPKFVANMTVDEHVKSRIFVTRYAVRQLGLPAEAYPLTANLFYRIETTPPPGTAEFDPMSEKQVLILGDFRFQSRKEVGE